MHAALRALSIGCLMGLLIPAVSARDTSLSVSPETPASYDDLKKYIEKDGDDDSNIPKYLGESQCGGWQVRSVEGTIATVTGVPGRDGVWDGAILTGMATRKDDNGNKDIDDDFKFPPETKGLVTACNDGQESIQKKVWREKPEGTRDPKEIEQVDITYPHPRFEDPSCRWRPKEDDEFKEEAPDIPLKPLDEYDPPKLTYEELKDEPGDRQSPPNCENFCKMLNTYQYYDCLETDIALAPNPIPELPPIPYMICKPDRWGNKWLCTDKEAVDNDALCDTESTGGNAIEANSRTCTGPDCRCEEDGGPKDVNGCKKNPATQPEVSPIYYSYYRTYIGKYSRDAVTPEDEDDKKTDSAPVACYGFYDEFDPKFHQTQIKDRRCVINIDVANRQETQKEKGEYGQNSDLKDRDPNDWRNQRNNGSYDQWKDLWYKRFSGGFSLLNERVFSGSYSNNLTEVFLNTGTLDTATQRATEQLGEEKPLAPGSYIRSFDDTGERNVAVWWQTQQSAVASLLHPPIIRLILPSGWALGIDPADPYFAEPEKKILKPSDKRDDRIEVQINAEDDTLGAALTYLERSLLLHVVEEPVPAVVPVGSAVEFRARAEAWCAWYMRRENKTDCNSAPADVRRLIDTLETYATDIDQYRLLRAEIALYAAKILAIQQSVTKPVSDWMIDNIDAYQDFLDKQKVMRGQFTSAWRSVQEKMETFGSVTNMPWCMNQRFTLPVYSLLDGWLPARADGGSRSANGLPVIEVDANADIVVDLSTVAFMSGSIVLPVLQPIQVRVTDFPSPPSPNEEKPIPPYPELPSITKIQEALKTASDALPQPYPTSPAPPPIYFKPIDTQKATAQLAAIKEVESIIVGGGPTDESMNERYRKFWQSIGPFKDDDTNPEFNPDNKKGVAYKKPKLECLSWDDTTCQHVEMDLRERFMRIASRPLVFLKEDYLSKDEERGIGGPCVAQEDVCSPLHPENGGEKHLWEIIGPRTIKDTLETLRTDVRKATLPVPVGDIPVKDFPRYGTATGNLLPSYDVPRAIELFPRASSSSSTSSS